MKHLRNFIFDHMAIKSWSRYIPLIQRIMNSSTYKPTGFPPSVLLFGHALDLNQNLISDTNSIESTEISHNQWIQQTKYMQIFALGLAKKCISKITLQIKHTLVMVLMHSQNMKINSVEAQILNYFLFSRVFSWSYLLQNLDIAFEIFLQFAKKSNQFCESCFDY